jgi:hypothetical protein
MMLLGNQARKREIAQFFSNFLSQRFGCFRRFLKVGAAFGQAA